MTNFITEHYLPLFTLVGFGDSDLLLKPFTSCFEIPFQGNHSCFHTLSDLLICRLITVPHMASVVRNISDRQLDRARFQFPITLTGSKFDSL